MPKCFPALLIGILLGSFVIGTTILLLNLRPGAWNYLYKNGSTYQWGPGR